ncbi:MAG TPA: PAS domain S-box protein [Bacteroidota bacterium]|nr:PAS domain S-box protein [Bacteroidota bacterium]
MGENKQVLSISSLHKTSERMLLRFLQDHPLPVFIYDRDTLAILFVNKAVGKQYGHSRKKLLLMKMTDLLPKAEVSRFRRESRQTSRRTQVSRRWRHRVKNGEIIDVEVTTHPITFQNRAAMIAVVNDAVERARLHEELVRRESQLRATLYGIGDGVIATDRKGVITMMNPVAEKLTGWNEREAVGLKLEQVFRIKSELTGKKVVNPVKRVLREGIVVGLANHTLLLTRGGAERPIADAGAPIYDAAGKVAGVVLVFRDQTAEREAQRVLQDARDFAESVIETIREPLLVLDEQLEVVAANRSFYTVFQVQPRETIGRKLYHLGNGQWNIPELRRLLEDILPSNSHFDNFEVTQEFERIGTRTMLLNARRLFREPNRSRLILLAIEDVTERTIALNALRESEERFRSITSVISDYAYTFRVNPDKSLVGEWLSDSFTKTFGFTLAEVDARGGWQSMVYPEDLPAMKQHALKVASGSPDVCETRFVTRTGEVRWLRDYATPVWDKREERVVRIYGAAQDITEQKKVEQALRESEERYRNLIERANDGIAIIQEGRVSFVNPSLLRKWGGTMEQVLNTPFTKYIAPEEIPKVAERYRKRMAGEPVESTYETILLRLDGTRIPVEINAGTIMHGGKPADLVFIRDITERKRAEDLLKQSERQYRRLFENASDAIIIFEPEEENILDVNHRACELYGFTREEFIGRSLKSLSHDVPRGRERIREVLSRGSLANFETVHYRKDGREISLLVNASVIDYDGKTAIMSIHRDVTEWKKALRALSESEERYRALFEQAPVAIYLADPVTHVVIFANTMFLNLLGYRREEITTLTIYDFVAHTRESIDENYRRTMEEGYRSLGHRKWRRRDGSLVDVEVQVMRVQYGGKALFCGIGTDITKRLQVEKTLRESEQRYRSIVENITQAYYETDARGLFTYCNPGLIFASGYTEQELNGMVSYRLVAPEHRRKVMATYRQRLDEKRTDWSMEFMVQTKQGKKFWVEQTTHFEYDAQGKLLKTTNILRDIDERKKAEEELERSRALLSSIFEASRDGIILEDEHGDILYANSSFARIYGYESPEELIGKQVSLVQSPQDNERMKEYSRKRLRGEPAPVLYEFQGVRKDGSLVDLEVSVSVTESGSRKQILSVVRDITERKMAERERELLKQQLIQSQKLEGIGTLASGIAHDFNNILGIIMGHASLIEKNWNNPAKLSSSTETILQATERGAALVRQMLTFARKAESVPQPLDVNVLLKEMGKMLRETFPKTIEINLRMEKDLPSIIADPTQIHQVILNLSVNARDAMPNGGTLTISSARMAGEVLAHRFPTADAQEYVELAVADTGLGIEPQVGERMFEPFFTTKPPGRGTGLGLSVVHGIVTSHQGFIDYETVTGKGTTFKVYFPIPHEPVELQTALPGEATVRGGTETLLLIEDEQFLREMVQNVLTAEGYRVLVARDGEEGVRTYFEHREEISLVLSDLGLPRLSGAQVARRIRDLNPRAHIVIVSGYYEPNVRAELQELGVDYLMAKPYRSTEILKVVRDVLDKPV